MLQNRGGKAAEVKNGNVNVGHIVIHIVNALFFLDLTSKRLGCWLFMTMIQGVLLLFSSNSGYNTDHMRDW